MSKNCCVLLKALSSNSPCWFYSLFITASLLHLPSSHPSTEPVVFRNPGVNVRRQASPTSDIRRLNNLPLHVGDVHHTLLQPFGRWNLIWSRREWIALVAKFDYVANCFVLRYRTRSGLRKRSQERIYVLERRNEWRNTSGVVSTSTAYIVQNLRRYLSAKE